MQEPVSAQKVSLMWWKDPSGGGQDQMCLYIDWAISVE